jgi:small-conductance mechanosensitive channel
MRIFRNGWPSGVSACLLCCAVLCAATASASQPSPTLEAPGASSAEPGSKEALDRQTPRRTMDGFLKKAKDGDFRMAASYLDLRGVPGEARVEVGPELAWKLAYVLERQPNLDLSMIPDEPEGDPNSKGTFVAARLYAGEEPVPIVLKREHFPDGVDRWLIAQTTVDLIPRITAVSGPRPIVMRIPVTLRRPTLMGNELWQWMGLALGVPAAYLVGRSLAAILVKTVRYFTKRVPRTRVYDALVKSARRPLRTIIAAVTYRILLGPLQLTASVMNVCEHVVYTALILGITWLILRALGVSTIVIEELETREGSDAFSERQIRTRLVLLRRILGVTIGALAIAVVFLQFEFVRSVGLSLLASAGVVSVVVGLAAQKSLGTIIGGIQFSIAQPVRVSDQVVVEGEFGAVEEVHLTYVVVRLWDKRCLVVPITYFLEKPFQNWTRSAMDLIGAIVLKVSPEVPVDAVRAELKRICEADPLWDRQTCAVQVTDADTTSVTLRVLVSAEDAPRLWDLRCRVREYLVAFVHADSLARRSDVRQVST